MRSLLANALHAASLWSGDALRRAKAVRSPRILMYHGIHNEDVGPELFSWQLAMLQNEFELVSLDDLLLRIARGTTSGYEMVITFDDGLRNHATIAYSILLQYRVPATFFICPGLVESGRWIWNMESRVRLNLMSVDERRLLASQLGAPAFEIERMIAWAKQLQPEPRRHFETHIQTSTKQFAPSAELIDRYAPMTWEQVAKMDPALITIGSHTVSHPILPTLSEEEIHEEIDHSRRWLERRLGRDVGLFCYPNGDSDRRATEAVRRTFRAAVTTRPAFVSADDDACLLPRIPAGGNRGLFVRRLHRPAA